LDTSEAWPDDVLDYLSNHHNLFRAWEKGGSTLVSAQRYDRALEGLWDVLKQYTITGWHCTRLTDAEAAAILSDGMRLPDADMLHRRIDTLVSDGIVTATIAARLKTENRARHESRAGRVWFCFFPPRLRGESGIGGLLRFWGGEALYSEHDRDPETGPILRSIGRPCLVEAEVPIAMLEPAGSLYFKIVLRYLISRGYKTVERADHEDRIRQPLAAAEIRRIITFPDPEFVGLTGCNRWHSPLP
jgi:hypothetical protein